MLPILTGNYESEEKPLEELEIDDLDLDEDDVEASTETVEVFLPPEKEAGKVLGGETDEQVKELVSLLKTEAKVL